MNFRNSDRKDAHIKSLETNRDIQKLSFPKIAINQTNVNNQ